MRAARWGAGLAALTILGAWWLHAREPGEIAVARAGGAAARSPAPRSSPTRDATAIAAGAASGVTAPLAPASLLRPPSLASAMARSRDLRAFAAEARLHPEAGGLSYAMFAAMLCRGVAAAEREARLSPQMALPYGSAEDPRAYQARAERRQRAQTACASYTAEELSPNARTEVAQQARAAGDALQALYAEIVREAKGSTAARQAALQKVLDRDDPLLLAIALDRATQLGGADGAYFLVDGRPLALADAEGYRAALRVIPCRFGLVCDERSPDVLAACLGPDACPEDRIALERARLSEEDRRDFDAALPRLEATIRERRASAFFR